LASDDPLTDRVPAGHVATSIEAFDRTPRAADHRRILAALAAMPDGATSAEIEEAIGMLHQTASARLNDLWRAGLIDRRGDRRNTPTGRAAYVWRLQEQVADATPVPSAAPPDTPVAESINRPRAPYVQPEQALCLGGCGVLVGVGQKCPDCAAAAIDRYYGRGEG